MSVATNNVVDECAYVAVALDAPVSVKVALALANDELSTIKLLEPDVEPLKYSSAEFDSSVSNVVVVTPVASKVTNPTSVMLAYETVVL
jgi:hypothetical protein